MALDADERRRRQAARSRAHYERNRDRIKAAATAWKRDNPERNRQLTKASYDRCREARRASEAAWRAKRPTYQAEYYETHRDQRIAKTAAWAAANPERARENHRRVQHRRRARRASAGIVPYAERDVFERDGWRCHLCGKPVDAALPRTAPGGATIDHLVPISAGGPDAPINVALAHNRCNARRAAGGTVQLRLIA